MVDEVLVLLFGHSTLKAHFTHLEVGQCNGQGVGNYMTALFAGGRCKVQGGRHFSGGWRAVGCTSTESKGFSSKFLAIFASVVSLYSEFVF